MQYEGEESSNNVFYTGAAPNQQAIPAVEYLMSDEGGAVKRWVLEGTDYVYPRTTNKILEAFLKSKGVKDEDIKINYTPFGYSDWQSEVAAIKSFASAGKKTAVVSTINGDANVPFYKELANQGVKASDIPVVAFSVGEEELAGIDTSNLVGHLAAWNYFQTLRNPTNTAFIKEWHDYIKNPKRVTNDPMEATYIGFKMWTHAVEQAGTTDVDAVRQAMYGQKVKAPDGYTVVMNTNHHLSKPVFIGEIQPTGQFNVVWKTKGVIKADAWSPYLAEDKGKVADWTYPWACGNCTHPNTRTEAKRTVAGRSGLSVAASLIRGCQMMVRRFRLAGVVVILLTLAMPAQAEDFAALVEGLATDGFAAEQQAVAALGRLGDTRAVRILKALRNSRLLKGPDGRVLISETAGDKPLLVDAVTGAAVAGLDPDSLDNVLVNDRLRGDIDGALGALMLFSPDPGNRLAAARDAVHHPSAESAARLTKALAIEKQSDIRAAMEWALSAARLFAGTEAQRLAAISKLGRRRIRRSAVCSTGCAASPLSIRRCAMRPMPRSRRSIGGCSSSASSPTSSKGSASAACCCSPRSGSRSPLASWASSTWPMAR